MGGMEWNSFSTIAVSIYEEARKNNPRMKSCNEVV